MTIREIAKLSGFSFKTVSRVINHDKNVKPQTRDKIMEIIQANNYKPNLYARNLNYKKGKNLLISIRKTKEFANSRWFDILLEKVIYHANKNNITVIVESFYSEDEIHNSVLYTSSSFVDTMVVFYETMDDQRIKIANSDGLPYVVFGKSLSNSLYVTNEDYRAVLEAYEFLFSNNLTKSCLILGNKVGANLDRMAGAKDAYEKHGISINNLEIIWEVNNLADAYQMVKNIINKKTMPDVFFVSGDEKVLAVYNALLSNGYRIPEDVSVIGFDNIEASQYYYPSLTTVSQDYDELANRLIYIVNQLLNGNTEIRSIEVPTKLIIRDSVVINT